MSFSQRRGTKPVKRMQFDSMDMDLRNGLWNALVSTYLSVIVKDTARNLRLSYFPHFEKFAKETWVDYFKEPVDSMPRYAGAVIDTIKERYYCCSWDGVYDFLEFVANCRTYRGYSQQFMDTCNAIMEREASAYRFVGGKITPITSDEEIAEVEKAIDMPISSVNEHLRRALDLLADKKSPDYRNSIKESISAVEATCGLVAKSPKSTLGNTLDKLEREGKVNIHPALKKAFDQLYGYTSSAEGIRHALTDEPNLNLEDARFMLIVCSAFINYLIMKSERIGIRL